MGSRRLLEPLSMELMAADFGDLRLTRRLGEVVDALAARPTESLPKALRSESALEGAYRFFDNDRVTPERILEPHVAATVERCRAADLVLAIHDTTQFDFGEETARSGLGPLKGNGGSGFFGHFTIAVAADGTRRPLGLLAMSHFVRRVGGKGQRTRREIRDDEENERLRWREQVSVVRGRMPSEIGVIHVMDREADSYALFCAMQDQRYIVRAQHDRVVELPAGVRVQEHERLRKVLDDSPVFLERTVHLSRRKAVTPSQKRIHPGRSERNAKLLVRATQIAVRRGDYWPATLPKSLVINVVQVIEVDTPPGEDPVEWILLTNLPIDNEKDVAFIVDSYRGRWIVEEYFKALKTGCSFEERQLETLPRLLNALATTAPVAWQLMLLRHLARNAPEEPATAVLSPSQISALRAFAAKPLPAHPTVQAAMLAVAQLGGHLRRNGEPGWQVLGRGFNDLLLFERGWAARTDGRRKM
jgi:hypothetical protein